MDALVPWPEARLVEMRLEVFTSEGVGQAGGRAELDRFDLHQDADPIAISAADKSEHIVLDLIGPTAARLGPNGRASAGRAR